MATMTTYTITSSTATGSNDVVITGAHASVYATARSTATGLNNSAQTGIIGQRKLVLGNWTTRRFFLAFDTSVIAARTAIVSVTMTLTCIATALKSCVLRVVRANWTAGTSPDDATYDLGLSAALEAGAFSDATGWSNNYPYTSGLLDPSWINRSGFTRYGVLSYNDRDPIDGDGIPPTDGDTNTEEVTVATANHTTAAYRPYLTVIGYIPPVPRRRYNRPLQMGLVGH